MEFDDKFDADALRDYTLELNDLIKNVSSLHKQSYGDIIDLASKLTKEAAVKYDVDKKDSKLSMDVSKIVVEQLKNLQDGNKLELQKFNLQKVMKKLNYESLSFEEKANAKIYLLQMSGLKKMIDEKLKINENGESYIDILKEQNDILDKQKEQLLGIGHNVDTFFKTMKVMAQNPKIAGGVLLAALVGKSKELFETISETRTQLGLSGKDSLIMAKNITSASMQGMFLGIGMKESSEAASAIYKEFKSINNVNKDAILQVAKLNKYYGVSAEEGAKLYKVFSEMQPLTGRSAKDSFKFYKNIAETNGLSVGNMMSEVAQNTEYFAKYSKNGGDNIAKTVAVANKLGLSLANVESIATNLLNVDSSIEAEMSASVLTGKQLNFNKARELALAGKHDEMMKEILKNQFNISEWNSWDVIQRQKVAESLGLSVEQMQNMISQQDNINKLTDKYGSKLGNTMIWANAFGKKMWENKETIFASMNFLASMKTVMPGLIGGIGKLVTGAGQWIMSLVKGIGIQKAVDGASNVKSGGGLLKNVKKGGGGGIFKKATEVQKMSPPTNNLKGTMQGNPIVNWINSWKTMDVKALLKFSLAVGILLVSIPLLALALKQFSDVPFDAVLKGMGSMLVMAGIMKIIGNMNKDVLKGALALGIMSLALIPLGFALKQFTDIEWKTLGIAGVALLGLTGALFGLGALISGPGAIIFGAGVLGFIAMGIALTSLGIGLQMVTSPLSQFVPMITQLATISGSLVQIGFGFSAMSIGLIAFTASLLGLAPLLPVLASVVGLTQKLTPIQTSESSKQGSTDLGESKSSKEEKIDSLLNSINQLVSELSKEKAIIINDREVGRYLGLKMDRMKVNGI